VKTVTEDGLFRHIPGTWFTLWALQYRHEGDIMAFRFPFIPRQRICLVAGSFETAPRMAKSEKPQSLPPVF
jgi:hypothetical protein